MVRSARRSCARCWPSDQDAGTTGHVGAKQRLADAEAKLRRFQDAIGAGVDPLALVDAINEAQEKRAAAQAELSGTPKRAARVAADVYAMIDSLGDVKKVIRQADPDELQRLYEALNVEIVYNATGRMLDATIRPVGRDKASVRGRS
jgi:cell division septum initiation protein DivIVA